MSQDTVYEWMKKHPTWHSIIEITKGLTILGADINKQSVTVNCYKLRKFRLLECRKSKTRGEGVGYNQLEYKYLAPEKLRLK